MLKNILGALAITGAVMTCAGCPDNKTTGGSATTGTDATTATGTAAAAASGAAATAAMGDDDKHKLYQAAAMTGDANMVMTVNKKIGIMKDDGMPTDAMQKFTTEHGAWAQNNVAFIQSMSSPDKAKEYVNSHK